MMNITRLWNRRARSATYAARRATARAYGAQQARLQAQIDAQARHIAVLDERLRIIGRVEARAEQGAMAERVAGDIKADLAAIRKSITAIPRHHRR